VCPPCLWIKHTKLHVTEDDPQPDQTVTGNYRELQRDLTPSRSQTEKKYKKRMKTPNRRERPWRGNGFLKGAWLSQRLVGSCRALHTGGGPTSPAAGTRKQEDLHFFFGGGCSCNPHRLWVRGCTQLCACPRPCVPLSVSVYAKAALGLVTGDCLEISSMVCLLYY